MSEVDKPFAEVCCTLSCSDCMTLNCDCNHLISSCHFVVKLALSNFVFVVAMACTPVGFQSLRCMKV